MNVLNLSNLAFSLLILLFGCKSTSTNEPEPEKSSSDIPAVYAKIYGAKSISSDGTFLTIKTTGVPDHKSPYQPTSGNLFETFTGSTFTGVAFRKNPNVIEEQNYTFKIPLDPKEATTKKATPLGPIGVSLNGVPFFNQYAGPNQPLTTEVQSFDQYWGHPTATSQYHYHVEPLYLTKVKATRSSLLGFLLDGFPVYGPEENGKEVTNAMLDAYHGHTSVTADYPQGIYHYHISSTDPYLNGNGFFGTAGTVTR